jgi:hypothetical protein
MCIADMVERIVTEWTAADWDDTEARHNATSLKQ